jgi:pyruvate/2-oxoglutarate dehydrogenase complex dihydrolipoamide acyltransferase (E2) component
LKQSLKETPMRSLVRHVLGRQVPLRHVLAVVVVAAGPVLSACSSLDSLDPTELFDSKKKLGGERKPVFPEGVPGVTSGVPPELVKGYREPEGGIDPAKAAAAEAAASEAKTKKPPPQRTASKPKPKPADAPSAAQAPPSGGGWPSPQSAWPGSR